MLVALYTYKLSEADLDLRGINFADLARDHPRRPGPRSRKVVLDGLETKISSREQQPLFITSIFIYFIGYLFYLFIYLSIYIFICHLFVWSK